MWGANSAHCYHASGAESIHHVAKTTQQMLNVCMQVDANKESIIQISLEATQEAALEASLAHLNSKVFALEIPISPYKDYKDAYILGNLEHMTTILDDSIMTVATILASRYTTRLAISFQ